MLTIHFHPLLGLKLHGVILLTSTSLHCKHRDKYISSLLRIVWYCKIFNFESVKFSDCKMIKKNHDNHVFRCGTGPQRLPKRVLHKMRYSPSCFKFQYLIFSVTWTKSCLHLLPHCPFPYICPLIMCFRRNFVERCDQSTYVSFVLFNIDDFFSLTLCRSNTSSLFTQDQRMYCHIARQFKSSQSLLMTA